MEKKLLEYFVPIESSAELNGDFMINGIAINETVTSNGHKFIAEELRESANTLMNVPLLKDHNNSVDSIVGKVKTSKFDELNRNISFSAIVKDKKIQELIKDGLLNSVSVGAHVNPQDIEEDADGNLIPHNIQFKELSVVAVPADGGATFTRALNNAYNSQENNYNNERGDKTMTKEEVQEESKVEETIVESKVEEKSITEEQVKQWVAEAIKSLKESDDDEVEPKEEEKPIEEPVEPKEEESEEDESEEVEEKSDYKMKQSFNSFGIERKSYNYN